VNHKRVERIWRREGLKVPRRQPKRGRLWLADGACVRLRPERANHVWAYDFVEDRTRDGRRFRMPCAVDEFSREALAIRAARRLSSADVIDTLADLFILRGIPAHVRSDRGPEFAAAAVEGWITGVGAAAAYIEKGSPWETDEVEKPQSAAGAIFFLRTGDRAAKSGARRWEPRRAAYDGRSSLAAPVRARCRLGPAWAQRSVSLR
jgi:putative transposase